MARAPPPAAALRAHDPPPSSFDPLAVADPKELELTDVLYRKSDGVATVEIHRPGSLNAYTTHTLRELAIAVDDAARDDAVGVIVLTGSGSRAFCTGGDVKEYADRYVRRPHDYWKYMGFFQGAVESLLTCGKPTIARLNGITVGGGNELHLACDLSVAASHIYLGQVGVAVGSVACGGATQWLPLAVGDRRARQMLLLNERVPAAKAFEWGLVSQVVPSVAHGGHYVTEPSADQIALALRGEEGYQIDPRALDAAVAELSGRLLAMFPECLRYTKQQTNFWKELAWHNTVGHGREWLALHFATREPQEGMSAFVAKRRPAIAELRRAMSSGDGADYLHGPPIRSCARCGEAGLPDGFKFCGACGAPLAPAARA